MADYVTHAELDAALADVREDIADTEQRLRTEWTDAVRYEGARTEKHLEDQDRLIDRISGRTDWILGLLVAALVAAVGALLYVALG